MTSIVSLSRTDALAAVSQLSEVLIDCVHGGASVSFLPPLDRSRADAFWRSVADAVDKRGAIILVAMLGERIAGTVLVEPAGAPNQPHRADVAKMLVQRSARNTGVGAALLAAAEQAARRAGKTLLVLDTVTGSAAERLYVRHGWQRCGEIPDYALWPDGRPCPTTIFYKSLLP